jgi:signal transduction histidine kinase
MTARSPPAYDRRMPAPPALPLLTRVPPGLWTALAWFTAAVYPIVRYVVVPPRHAYSLSYPADGLDAPAARVLLLLAGALVAAGCVVQRRRPAAAFGLVLTGTVVSALAWRQDDIPTPQFLAVDIVLAHVAATRPRRISLAAAGAALGVLAVFAVLRPLLTDDGGALAEPLVALTVAVAWLLGHSVAQSRAHAAELHARAAAQAVTAERLRIAREMHDTVAHSIGVIALQAGAAARVVESRPALAREAMLAVEATGRETLAGLRQLIGAMRRAEPGTGPGEPRPPAGLGDLPRLAAATTAAGVRVDVEWRGEGRSLPPDVDLAAFRVVQEAVTNVLRHSGATACRVVVDRRAGELAVEVTDHGWGGDPDAAGGYGLAGLRERVALLRGDLAAGPRPGGGFRVAARLPLPAPRTEAVAG